MSFNASRKRPSVGYSQVNRQFVPSRVVRLREAPSPGNQSEAGELQASSRTVRLVPIQVNRNKLTVVGVENENTSKSFAVQKNEERDQRRQDFMGELPDENENPETEDYTDEGAGRFTGHMSHAQIGRAIALATGDCESPTEFQEIVVAMGTPSSYNMMNMANFARNTFGSERNIWDNMLGLAYQVNIESEMNQSLINRLLCAERALRQTSLQITDEMDFFSCGFCEDQSEILSVDSESFLSGVELVRSLKTIQSNLKGFRLTLGIRQPSPRSLWRYSFQGMIYKALADKGQLEMLTYRPVISGEGKDGSINIAGIGNYNFVTQLLELFVKFMRKWGDAEERMNFMIHAGNTLQDALKELRRDIKKNSKKRHGAPDRGISFYEKLNKPMN